MNTVDVVFLMAKPVLKNLGLEIWDIVFEKEGANWFLRIYLDKNGSPVTIDDCEMVSNYVSKRLDKEDPIKHSYFLEVSSPGLGRKLRKKEHFLKMLGEQISLKLYSPLGGKKQFFGILRDFKNGNIKLETQDEMLSIPLSACSHVKLDDDLDLV